MTSPRTLLKAKGIHPKKQLGQNFLSDPSTPEMIVKRAGITKDDVVFEIGAGLGALTLAASKAANKVYAVETDRRILSILKDELAAADVQNVILIENNILNVDIAAIAKEADARLVVMGNLPYNISSQVLVQLISSRDVVSRAILMFQKELAQRIVATPNCKDYGRLTVMLQYCATIKSLAEIKADMFFPKPRVDSSVVDITFHEALEFAAQDERFLFKVIKAAFGQRRKTLRNALSGSELHIDTKMAGAVLEKAGIDSKRRAETLTVAEFVRLSDILETYPEHP
ncbi:MAG: 16S rRNA (adenine(1518)-N(6)/adenine(1519)-N(6))-dimethyltransferase RsmA [Desulfobacterales bacterium]|nr:16S rRNA (adenine(1518)-N(6)/adenine(1519)-N(6))-dimethyltransferase RsmA [Desulfobacterales bacterium]